MNPINAIDPTPSSPARPTGRCGRAQGTASPRLILLAAGIFLAALGTSLGRSTVQFTTISGVTFLDPSNPRPSEPVNVLQISGTADTTVSYAVGALGYYLPVVAYLPGAVATVQTWAGFNGCQNPVTDAQPSLDLTTDVAGLDTTVTRHTSCPPGCAVELWTINGGGHAPTMSTNFTPRVSDWLFVHPKS